MNKKKITAEAQHLQQSDSLDISENIEDYIDYLFRFMKNLMNLTVLWTQSMSDFACLWWTEKMQKTVWTARKTRHYETSEKTCAVEQHKKKTIQRTKTVQFQKSVHEVFKSEDIWKLMQWVEERSHLLSESSIMSKLIEMQENESMWEANTAEEKTNQLRAWFFSEKTETDLSDIEDFQYLQSVEQLSQIISEMISDVMSKQLLYSASEADKISNVFLKIISESFVKTAAALT